MAATVWVESIISLSDFENDHVDASIEAILACAFDPLSISQVCVCVGVLLTCSWGFICFSSQVSAVVHNILRRGIHAGLLSLVGCLAHSLQVPYINIKDLCDFFKSPEVSYLRDLSVVSVLCGRV